MVVVAFMIVLMSTTILPALPENIRLPVCVVVATVQVFLVVFYIAVTTINPADPAVIKKWHDEDNNVNVWVSAFNDQYCPPCKTLV